MEIRRRERPHCLAELVVKALAFRIPFKGRRPPEPTKTNLPCAPANQKERIGRLAILAREPGVNRALCRSHVHLINKGPHHLEHATGAIEHLRSPRRYVLFEPIINTDRLESWPSTGFLSTGALRLAYDARRQHPQALWAVIVIQLHGPHVGAHLVVQELNDARELRRNLVRDEHELDATGSEVSVDLSPILASIGILSEEGRQHVIWILAARFAHIFELPGNPSFRPERHPVSCVVQHLANDLPSEPRIHSPLDLYQYRRRLPSYKEVINRPTCGTVHRVGNTVLALDEQQCPITIADQRRITGDQVLQLVLGAWRRRPHLHEVGIGIDEEQRGLFGHRCSVSLMDSA